jgi:hypothetical protein
MKDFIPYEQAFALKELGFDEPCFGYYEPNGELDYIENHILKDFPYLAKNSEWQDLVAAPTFSQSFRFFREKYDLRIWIESNYGVLKFEYVIATTNPNFIDKQFNDFSGYKTYEEAELACLIKLIEIVKTKQQ